MAALHRYGILDTAREAAFDDFARLAADVCEAPIAVVNLVDSNRQWFKSEIGLGVRETPLDVSICVHAIRQPGLFVVPDTTRDPRFADNPYVADAPHLRFYAGARLETPEGLPVGTLCVLDHKPRPDGLTERQGFALQALARQVMAQLELRRALKDQARAEAELRAAHAEITEILEGMGDAFYALGPDGRILYVNGKVEALWGRRNAEVRGRAFLDIFPGLEGTPYWEPHARALRERVPSLADAFCPISASWVSIGVTPAAGGGITVCCRDITQRRQAEAAQHEDRERLRRLIEQAATGIAQTDPTGRLVLVNDRYCELLGRSREDLLTRRMQDLTHPEDLPANLDQFARMLETGEKFLVEKRYLRPDGSPVWVHNHVSLTRDAEGTPQYAIAVVEDVTERKRADEALRQSEQRWRTLAELLPQLVWSCRPDGACDYLGPQWIAYTGITAEDQFGRGWLAVVHPDDQARTEACWEAAIAGRAEYDLEHRLRRADGEYRWFQTRGLPQRDDQGRVVRWLGTCTDIENRKREEAEQRRAGEARHAADRRLFTAIIEGTDDFVAALDMDLRLIAFNRATQDEFERVFGRGIALGESLIEALAHLPEEQANAVALWRRAIAGEEFTVTQEFGDPLRRRRAYEIKHNTLRDAEGKQIGAFTYTRDVTDRLRIEEALRASEEQLRQAYKMEAIGQLTGGIAHDFNNMLTGILGSLELVRARIEKGRLPDAAHLVGVAMGAAQRAGTLTHRLLTFARRQALDPGRVDVNALIASLEDLARRTLGEAIEVETALAEDVWPVLCDANQLENALLNLVINARDAMPQGGRLTIATANAHPGEAGAPAEGDPDPGPCVLVSVRDTGIGMAPDIVARAFDPFFTTKPLGQGTGLGLSMLYGFVKQSNGHVRIDSAPGQGTTVRIYLPRHPGGEASEVEAPQPEAASGGGTVLVVEDEATVRMLMLEVLRQAGYAALAAEDGPSGLRILQSEAKIDLLLTDVGLPGMDGRVLARRARKLRPELKVLFVTAYAQDAASWPDFPGKGMHLVRKPFALDALAAKIRGIVG